jgi:hypothetical protein
MLGKVWRLSKKVELSFPSFVPYQRRISPHFPLRHSLRNRRFNSFAENGFRAFKASLRRSRYRNLTLNKIRRAATARSKRGRQATAWVNRVMEWLDGPDA